MKNKRTKLTAILLSALMAVSTISSVTWAADLFTDGSNENDVALEAPTEFYSVDDISTTVTEESESAESTELLGIGKAEANYEGAGIDDVTWFEPWDGDKEFVPTGTTFDEPAEKKGAYQVDGNGYKVHALVGGSWTDLDATFDSQEPANCEHPARVKVKFNVTGILGDLYAYSYSESTNLVVGDHTLAEITIAITAKKKDVTDPKNKSQYDGTYVPANCTQSGKVLTYTYCTTCGKLKKAGENGQWQSDAEKTITDTLLDTKYTIESYINEQLELNNTFGSLNDYINVKEDPASGQHIPGPVQKTIIPPADNGEYDFIYKDSNSDGWDDYDVNRNGKIDSTKEIAPSDWSDSQYEHFMEKANCELNSDNTVSGAMDPARDAFYYEVVYCERCGQVVRSDKIVFYHAQITEGSEFYLGVKNIYGFINKKGNLIKGNRISKDDFKGVVLANCEIEGVYNLCVSSKNVFGEDVPAGTYSVTDTKIEPAGHKWDAPILTPDSTKGSILENFASDNIDRTKNPPQLKAKEENGEWVVHSKNCKTEAFYTAKQYCKNPNCKYNNVDKKYSNPDPSIAGSNKALPGPHEYYTAQEQDHEGHKPGRYVDYSQTVYTMIKDANGEVDKEHHLEQYKDHVQCKLCYYKTWLDSETPDAVVKHTMVPQAVEGTKTEATCGKPGSYDRRDTCICKYYDESTRTTVTIPATDDHKFGDNAAKILWTGGEKNDGAGAIFIEDDFIPGISIHADIVRECTECGALDSNGINTMGKGDSSGADVEISRDPYDFNRDQDPDHFDPTTNAPGGKWCAKLHVKDLVPAKADPATGISYRCSTAHATIYVEWVGTVDGKLTKLNGSKENVPYYKTTSEYQARASHTPGKPQKEGDEIVTRCTVCGDIVAREADNTASVGVPTVTASSVDFDTVNVNWTKVEGATAYRLYYRSSDEGISKWAKIRTFTGDTTSYAVNGLTTGSKYRFTVRAEVTQDGKTTLGDYSKKGAVAVPKLTTPEIKSVTASGKTTKVTWSRVDGASGYIVFRNSQRVGTVTKGSKVTWTDKKPVSGAKYQLRAYRTEDKKNFKSNLSEPK